jgi:hypothetical protein
MIFQVHHYGMLVVVAVVLDGDLVVRQRQVVRVLVVLAH